MKITKLDISLNKYRIGISGAVPGRGSWSEPAMDRAILEFVALFSGMAFKYGAQLIHGFHPSFTPVIVRQARLHARKDNKNKPLTLVMSALWENTLSGGDREALADVSTLVITPQVGKGGPEDVQTRNSSLSAMRRVLMANQDATVVIGGKMHARDGKIPGVREEMDLAAKRGIPRFLVAGMGGYAAEYAKELTPSDLNNGLSDEENRCLFSSTDVAASVNIIFECLVRLQEKPPAQRMEPPSATGSWPSSPEVN